MNGRSVLRSALGALAGLAITVPALAGTGRQGYWDHHGMMWGGGSGWFLGPLMMLLFLVVAVVVVVLVVRWLGGPGGGVSGASGPSGKSALRILEERFARGEIDEEEFRERKRALEE